MVNESLNSPAWFIATNKVCFCVTQACFSFCKNQWDFFLYVKQVLLSFYVYNVLLTFWSSKDLFEWTLNGTDHSGFIKHTGIFICVKKSQIWNDMNFKFWMNRPFNAILYNVIVENSVLWFRSLGRFLNDNAPVHKATFKYNWFTESDVEEFDRPAQNPDMNPIEYLYDDLCCNKQVKITQFSRTPLYAITLIVLTEITGIIRPIN